ncbi:sulfur carrier protein ThiS [Phosphitispora sp. TUW77]|uniref:sulfur carrier protein ThiS n=1 Tax=Phosphitispora sp. TUW77 TaxID=3152361 RepID=UPI003AB5A654
MQIKINGKVTETEPSLSIACLLEARGIMPGAVVVQYNGDIIDKGVWSEIVLKENDELEILRFVGGG